MSESEFEFSVAKVHHYYTDEPFYRINLPHQCDEWTIAYTNSLQEAEDLLIQFIKEAQEALEKLRELE